MGLGVDMDANIVNIKGISMKMLTSIKQHLSYIWSSIHKKVKQHWGWVEKNNAYKTACNSNSNKQKQSPGGAL